VTDVDVKMTIYIERAKSTVVAEVRSDRYVTHSGPEVLFKTCVAMKFVDDDDDDDDVAYKNVFRSRQ